MPKAQQLLRIAVALAALAGACTTTPRIAEVPLRGRGLVIYALPTSPSSGPNLWLYDSATDRLQPLTKLNSEVGKEAPKFIGSDEIMFLQDGDIHRTDLFGASPQGMRGGGPVHAYAWNSKLGILAYVSQRPVEPSGAGPDDVTLFTPRDGKKRFIKRFFPRAKPSAVEEEGDGDTPELDEEVSLAWSPDGERLLLVDTHMAADERRSLYIFDRSGRQEASQADATHAVWSADSESVYFLRWKSGMEGKDQPVKWWSWHVDTARLTALNITAGRMHPTLSPDGRFLALDDAKPWIVDAPRTGCTCTVYVYDLVANKERALVSGYIAPRWVSDDVLLATAVRGCVDGECGTNEAMWVDRETTALIATSGERVSPAAARSTLQADVRLPEKG
jgi:hypothetical protein